MAEGTEATAFEMCKLSVDESDNNDDAIVQTARANFPLPRELRDQIYGYLLYHPHVHQDVYASRSSMERGEVSSTELNTEFCKRLLTSAFLVL